MAASKGLSCPHAALTTTQGQGGLGATLTGNDPPPGGRDPGNHAVPRVQKAPDGAPWLWPIKAVGGQVRAVASAGSNPDEPGSRLAGGSPAGISGGGAHAALNQTAAEAIDWIAKSTTQPCGAFVPSHHSRAVFSSTSKNTAT